jgi:prepilin-type N-terminal cleavage/methylation domain-containing protein
MLKSNFKYLIQNLQNGRGFSLLELMVVMVIVGILALGVVFMFADPTAKIKAVAFEMRGDIHLARSHAVTDNQDVLIDFGTAAEGYNICVDDWDAGADAPGTDGACAGSASGNDTPIKEVVFRENVEYYEFAALPTNGPDTDPPGTDLSPGTNGRTLGGAAVGATTLTLFPDGTCDNAGSIIVYYSPQDDSSIKGDPYAVVIENTVTSRIIIQRWRRDKSAWFRK